MYKREPPNVFRAINPSLNFHPFYRAREISSHGVDPFQSSQGLHFYLNIYPSALKDSSQYKIEDNTGVINVPTTSKSRMSKKLRTQILTRKTKKRGKKYQVKFDPKHVQITDTIDAVEFSIAASEALAISEIVRSGSESLPAAAVLEVALHVKQARNHLLSDGVHAEVTVEVDETDLLSDLDDDIMEDAFQDVGLSVTQVVSTPENPCCSSSVIKHGYSSSSTNVSHVTETPFSENHHACDDEVQIEELIPQKVHFDGTTILKRSVNVVATDSRLTKDLQIEYLGCLRQNEFCTDSPLGFKHQLYQSVQTESKILTNTKKINNDLADISQAQANVVVSSPRVQESGKAGEEIKDMDIVPKPFTSRWFGGWTGEDVEVSVHLNMNITKSIPKFFNEQTSFLSESADVPDVNSFLPEPELEPQIVSLPSVAFQGLCGTNETEVLSQDFTSSSLSLVDPLCSFVPCSISSSIADVTLTTNQKIIEEEARKQLNPKLWLLNSDNNLRRSSFEFSHGEGDAMLMTNGEGSGGTTRRQLTSLKTYSMLLPSHNPRTERVGVYSDDSLPKAGTLDLDSSEEIIGCFESSDIKDCTKFLFRNPVSKYSASKDYRSLANVNPIAESADRHKNSHESAVNLNNGTQMDAPACKADYNTGIANLEKAPIPDMMHSENIVSSEDKRKREPLSLFHSSQHPHAHQIHVPARKRVCFSETEVRLYQSKTDQNLHSSYQRSSITKTCKSLKGSGLQSDLRRQEVNACPTTFHIKKKKKRILEGIEFLLTGFTRQKETELGMLIRKHGGFVLSDVPSLLREKDRSRCKHELPVVLSLKKLQTTKFLYGCAANAFLLQANWLTDSIASGYVLPPDKYMIISNRDATECRRIGGLCCNSNMRIFDRVGIMLDGKHSFCTKMTRVVKHGGGQVFKTLHWLVQSLKNEKITVGVIVAEDEGRTSRHLRQCASEQRLPVMPANWIINSLHLQKLLPFKEKQRSFSSPAIKIPELCTPIELSQEI